MKGNKTWIGLALLAVAILVVAFVIYDKLPSSGGRTLNAQGVATISSLPDEVSVLVNIEVLKDTAEEAKDENSRISENVQSFLRVAGITDIETMNYNIYEEFDWTDDGRESLGYKATNMLKVKTKDFDLIGKIIDISINAGATNINSVNFELSEEKQAELKREALAKASADARLKAEGMAAGLGAKLGKIMSISDSSYNYRPYPMFDMAETMAAGEIKAMVEDVVINPRKLEVRANVNVVFALK